MFRKILDFFIFSSLFISCCAVVMVYQTIELIQYQGNTWPLYGFVFFAALCSYNFHWYLSPTSKNERIRSTWALRHRSIQLFFLFAGGLGAAVCLSWFSGKIYWLIPSILLTFLYSAPKIPLKPFAALKKIAIGKTFYLSFVWAYVTSALPILLYSSNWSGPELWYCFARFSLIYTICILFDFRDREQDKIDGIKSLVTFLGEKAVDRLFFFSLAIFFATSTILGLRNLSILHFILMILPGLILLGLYPIAKRNFSDYLYYLVLDGLMMISGLCILFLSI